MKWTGVVPFEGWQLLQDPQARAKGTAKGEKLIAASDALREILADGLEHDAAQIEAELRRNLGISHGTVWEAKTRIGVKATKGEYRGGWKWHLPSDSWTNSQSSDSSDEND